MKQISIESILSIKNLLTEDLYKKYLFLNNIKIKDDEVVTLDKLKDLYPFITNYNFYFGYEIPQLGKEFDLLTFNDEKVLNIEIKRKATKEAIKTQLLRNLFYLESLNLKMELISFNKEEESLYQLNLQTLELEKINSEKFKLLLEEFIKNKSLNLDNMFLPSKYLISPFNNTKNFFENRYLLTSRQEEISNEVLQNLSKKLFEVVSIEGNPGTGKTLLTYHIGKKVFIEKKVLIIHCGNLNEGHEEINKKVVQENFQLQIIPIKHLKNMDVVNYLSNYDLLIIDEAQRIHQNQLERIIESLSENKLSTIFSYDPRQTLSEQELNSKSIEIINSISNKKYKLKGKIRTNKEIAAFTKNLFDLNKVNHNLEYNNITLEYFNCPNKLREYLSHQNKDQWRYIKYTNSLFNRCSYDSYQNELNDFNSHNVIGQEFDKVITVIDSSFYYDKNRLRSAGNTGGTGYNHVKMLYQNITRVRKELKIIILNNEEMFKKIINILDETEELETKI